MSLSPTEDLNAMRKYTNGPVFLYVLESNAPSSTIYSMTADVAVKKEKNNRKYFKSLTTCPIITSIKLN